MNKLLITSAKINRPLKVIYFLVLVTLIFLDILAIFFLPQVGLGFHVGYSVCVESNLAFITNNEGTVILDTSNPVNPRRLGIVATSDGAFGVTVKDDLAYIASDSNGFIIANISDPENPLITGQYNDGGSANSVCTNGSYAYVTEYPHGMEIFDISNPDDIIKVTEYDDGGEFSAVAIKDNFIYLPDSGSGLKVLNVTDPSSPKLVSISPLPAAIDVYIHNNLIFLGCHRYGVYIFDISTPHSPSQLGNYHKLGGEAYGVTGNTTHLYVADLQLGVYLLNITDPSHPTELVSYSNAAPHDILFDGSNIYLADQDKQLIILDEHLDPLYTGLPRDISLQLVLIGVTIVASILPIYWFRKRKNLVT
ncbi:MAG: LVIVD repeat-containing protein [Candidatus Thorarchaeota archaeon]